MPIVLKNILSFTGLVVGVPSVQAHGINLGGRAVTPKTLEADGGGYTITADDTNVTVTRVTGAATVKVYCDYWHSMIDAEPQPNGISALDLPFVTQHSGGGGGTVGPGTINQLAKFTAADEVGDSQITDTGTAVQIAVKTTIAGSTTSSATAERLLLKSTNAANDRSSIQWLTSAGTHKWAMGNQVSFDLAESSFFFYDWTNNFYPIIVRDGTAPGQRSYFVGGVPGSNGGIAFERSTGLLSLVINATGGSSAGGDRFNINVSSVIKGPDTAQFAWANSTAITDPTDLAIGRSAAGVAEINNGTPGTLRALSASVLYASGGVAGPSWQSGAGDPNGVVTAPVGSLYSRTDGGVGSSLYVKETGVGNTGWAAK